MSESSNQRGDLCITRCAWCAGVEGWHKFRVISSTITTNSMSLSTEALFTAALGLQSPWQVKHVELSTAKRRIDFEVECKSRLLSCPHCGHADQGIHDRVDKSWRHLDFFQYEAWLHAPVPRVACTACGKTTQVQVPWAREGSGFTLLFETLALSLCKELPVAQAARATEGAQPQAVAAHWPLRQGGTGQRRHEPGAPHRY